MTIQSLVLDIDGTLVRGEKPIPGASETVGRLQQVGFDLCLLSNNPTRPPDHYAAKLAESGFEITADEVVTCGLVTADYLAAEHADDLLFVVGETGLLTLLNERDLRVTEDPDAAEVVVVSIDREFTYDKLREALWALDGAKFVATDPDRTIPVEGRLVPGSGAIVAAVAGTADREPDVLVGKPAEPTVEAVLPRLAGDPEDCLVVGDRLDTDIAFGERAGMQTALVLSGVTTRDDVAESDIDPDYVLDSLADVDSVAGLSL